MVSKLMVILINILLSGCAASWSWGPGISTWGVAPPVVPGFTPVPLGNGGFVEEPTSIITGGAGTAPTPEQTTLQSLEEAQRTRAAIRSLAR